MINVDKIYDLMADRGFQEPRTGNLFFPAYIYTYPPEDEYEMRKQIKVLIDKLKRPNNYLDCLEINIFHELVNYLKEESFAGDTLFDLVIETEKEDPEEALRWIRDEMSEGNFFHRLEKKIKAHFANKSGDRVYLVMYGFGSSFPYLRASELLKNTEKLIKEFKVIVFYPGKYEDSNYNLFGLLNDENMYRANYLNQLLGEDK